MPRKLGKTWPWVNGASCAATETRENVARGERGVMRGHGKAGKRGLGRCACHAGPQKHGKTWPGVTGRAQKKRPAGERDAFGFVIQRDYLTISMVTTRFFAAPSKGWTEAPWAAQVMFSSLAPAFLRSSTTAFARCSESCWLRFAVPVCLSA